MKETHYILDVETQLKDAGAITSSAAAQVGGENKIIDLGGVARMRGDVVIDISALDIAGNDELYEIKVQGSSDSGFASDIEELAVLRVGPQETLGSGGDVDSDTGRYILPLLNERNGRSYRYLRAYTQVTGGSGGGSINYQAWLSKEKP